MLLSVLSTNLFLFLGKECVTPALWASFEDAEGAINTWPQLKSLIYNGVLDPTLRKKVSYVVWCDVNLSDVIFVMYFLLIQAWPLLLTVYTPDQSADEKRRQYQVRVCNLYDATPVV